MGKKPSTCVEFIWVMINLVFTVMGVGTIGFGFICFFLWKQNPSKESNTNYYFIAHRMLQAIHPTTYFSFDLLPKAWYYCVFLVALVTVELGIGAFMFFEHNWKEVMPKDRSGCFYRVYHFVNVNWEVARWVALGVLILQVIAMILALYLVTLFNHATWHRKSDDEVYLPKVRITPNYKIPPRTNSKPSTTTMFMVELQPDHLM
ncbi:hypothetical protein VNO78_06763 [Psophocarpus tetragonolobus]|uniref:Uncharacterized protein n=1 Tax=Psophocarpus tetragonolobus TaxID=3891 RepID=A0AAN9SVL0_PSOTE